jgi:predicted site-specific integrase-resolvase
MIQELTIDGVRYLAAKEAATRAGITHDYVTRWCREGRVRGRRIAGGVWFVSVPSLDSYLARRAELKSEWRVALRDRQRAEYAHAQALT